MANVLDLATLADLKGYVVSSGNDDLLLSRLITAGSTYIQSWLNRTLGSASYAETRDGTGGIRMVFSNQPVTAVSSVTIDGNAIPLSSGPTVSGYYFTPTLIGLRGYTFTQSGGNVSISYTAGYSVIPEDIRQSCIEVVALKYKMRDRVGVRSKSLAGESITFEQNDLSDSVKTLLNQYKNVVPE